MCTLKYSAVIDILRPGQMAADDIFKFIFNENCCVLIQISRNFVFIMQWPNWWQIQIGSDKGMAPNKRQAII